MLCELFYRQRSGPPPSDIKCCPPCAHLVNISTPHTLIAPANANQESHPVDIRGVDREEVGGGDGRGDKRGDAGKIDDREWGEDGGEGRGDEDMIFQSVLFNKDETTLSDVPSNTVRSRYWESKEAANLFGFQYGDDVYEGLEQRIQLLSDSVNQFHGYKALLREKEKVYQSIKYSTSETSHCTFIVHMILPYSNLGK